MKRLYSIIFLCLIPVLSNSLPQDSLNAVLIQQISELEERVALDNNELSELNEKISILESQQSKIKSDRSFVSVTTTVIAAIFAAITALIAFAVIYLVPRDLKMRIDKHEQTIKDTIKEIRDYIDEKSKDILRVSAMAHRTMFKLNVKERNHMLVVWSGRWMRDLVQQYLDAPNQLLLDDMNIIIVETFDQFSDLRTPEKKHLVMFRSLPEVKRDFQDLERFEYSSIIMEYGKKILQLIYSLEEEFITPDSAFPTTTQP